MSSRTRGRLTGARRSAASERHARQECVGGGAHCLGPGSAPERPIGGSNLGGGGFGHRCLVGRHVSPPRPRPSSCLAGSPRLSTLAIIVLIISINILYLFARACQSPPPAGLGRAVAEG